MFKGQRDQRAERLGLRGSQSCALQFELLETLQAALSQHAQRCPSPSLPSSQKPELPWQPAASLGASVLSSFSIKGLPGLISLPVPLPL